MTHTQKLQSRGLSLEEAVSMLARGEWGIETRLGRDVRWIRFNSNDVPWSGDMVWEWSE